MLATFGQELGLDREMALKVAGAFGGGMARMGETCGVVTGSMMAIGLKHGKTKADDDEAKEKTYRLVKDFVDRFKAKHNSIVCRDMLNCDMSTSEGLQDFKNRNLIETHCARFVKDAADILEEILASSRS
ncbi:MAG: C-GCAxxG-C-C family protein [Syntrophorhabdus sp.]